jgi:hypothetical protein
MLEPHVLGVRWRVPSVFRHKHHPWEAMEGGSLSDSPQRRGSSVMACQSNINLMSHSYRSSLDARPKSYCTCIL